MTLIFKTNNFWIERHEVTISLPDIAGRVFSGAINLDRAGHVVGFSCSPSGMPNNDNGEAVGAWEVRDAGGGIIAFGEELTAVSVRVNKQAGTAGASNITFVIMVFVRA